MNDIACSVKEKGGQIERFVFLETRLYWTGKFKRRYLEERFRISPTQQTKDMAEYHRLAPGNIYYNPQTYSYHPTPSFRPYFLKPESDALLGYLLADPDYLGISAKVAVLPRPQRTVAPEVVREVLLAIDFGRALEISYQSMNRPEPEERWFTPHALGHDGFRLHARALCHRDKKYKDFVLGRIIKIHGNAPDIGKGGDDAAWHDLVTVRIGPHPGLLPGPRKIIEAEYAMVDGVAEWNVRKAMLHYVLKHHHLIEEARKPEHQQIVLLNTDVLTS